MIPNPTLILLFHTKNKGKAGFPKFTEETWKACGGGSSRVSLQAHRNKPNRNRNVTPQGALSAKLVANRMWASRHCVQRRGYSKQQVQAQTGSFTQQGKSGRKGRKKTSFQPTHCSPAYLGFPRFFFLTELPRTQSFSSAVFTGSPHETGLHGKSAWALSALGEEGGMTGSLRKRGTGVLVKRHTVHCLAWTSERKKNWAWSRGKGKPDDNTPRNLWKLEKLYQLLHWANSQSFTLPVLGVH